MRIVSGIQPTGNLHLGNYLGAIRNWVRMQDEVTATGGESLFFLADLHSLSDHIDRDVRLASVRDMTAALIACGIDPAKSILFNQAAVPAHAELCWLLNGTARMGWLNRMTQWKDKAGKNREGASIALFDYPVLQAADVLLYQATHVPVGDDQKQHLELARDIATKFNTDTGVDLFTLPEPFIPPAAARIMSLRDGTAKMSKSDPSDMSRINLSDPDDAISQKVRKAKTDPEPLPSDPMGLAGRAEAANLVSIYAALADSDTATVLGEFGGSQFGPFKAALADRLIERITPIRERYEALRGSPELDRHLQDGAARARAVAAPTLARAYDALGLIAAK
ncbi:Tryptophan--tRNA ligase [Sphingomonas antarctica]|uniref:tryptophan--tRNA ligase n=1 Tax=Sphingomonas antarctica TaxID=2040274 RepID=UPI0039ED53C4